LKYKIRLLLNRRISF